VAPPAVACADVDRAAGVDAGAEVAAELQHLAVAVKGAAQRAARRGGVDVVDQREAGRTSQRDRGHRALSPRAGPHVAPRSRPRRGVTAAPATPRDEFDILT